MANIRMLALSQGLAVAVALAGVLVVLLVSFGFLNALQAALRRRDLPEWHAWFGIYALLEILLIPPRDRRGGRGP